MKALLWLAFLVIPAFARQPSNLSRGAGATTFHSSVNDVLIPVVVTDARGNEVTGLHRDDFQVLDNGKLQTLSGFSVQERTGAAESNGTPAKLALPNSGATETTPPNRLMIFLFDDLHLSSDELAQAQKATEAVLAESLIKSDAAAVFSISGMTNSGITRDQQKLLTAVRSVRVRNVGQDTSNTCPDLTYYQADLILNKDDERALKTSVDETSACSGLVGRSAENRVRAVASQVLNRGEQSTRITLGMIKFVIGELGKLPGQHILVLISPGFLTSQNQEEKSEIIDFAIQSNTIINTIDARGLYVPELKTTDPIGMAPGANIVVAKSNYKQDSLSAAGDVLTELASGTGGTSVKNNNDLATGLEGIVRPPEYLYLLQFTPVGNKRSASYHRLQVKVDQTNVVVHARLGYYEPKRAR